MTDRGNIKKVIDDLGRVRAFGQTMLDCNTDSSKVYEMIRDSADNAIALLKSQERYIEDLEQGVPFVALDTLSERVKELEAMLKDQEPKLCRECIHFDNKCDLQGIGKCRNSLSPLYCIYLSETNGCDYIERR